MNKTILRENVQIDESLLHDWLAKEKEDSQTIVFCHYISKSKYVNGGWVNIHPTTFLVSNNDYLKLLYAINIPVAPDKHHFEKAGQHKRFMLIFPSLPKNWNSFDFVESCSSGDGFVTKNISRNNTGIYEIYLK
jgi:hypothetical protein